MRSPLDNPVWGSLTTLHTRFAHTGSYARRYPAEIAPFVAVPDEDPRGRRDIERLVQPGELVYLVGVAPPLGDAWQLEGKSVVVQMIRYTPLPAVAGPEIVALSEPQRADMVALTALVFPGFFRARTLELGRYFGIYQGNVLAAMAGERMRLHDYLEISAVCTHPDFAGRGYATQLITKLTNESLQRGLTPFLHFSAGNARAQSIYERLGFTHRANLPMWAVTRRSEA